MYVVVILWHIGVNVPLSNYRDLVTLYDQRSQIGLVTIVVSRCTSKRLDFLMRLDSLQNILVISFVGKTI